MRVANGSLRMQVRRIPELWYLNRMLNPCIPQVLDIVVDYIDRVVS